MIRKSNQQIGISHPARAREGASVCFLFAPSPPRATVSRGDTGWDISPASTQPADPALSAMPDRQHATLAGSADKDRGKDEWKGWDGALAHVGRQRGGSGEILPALPLERLGWGRSRGVKGSPLRGQAVVTLMPPSWGPQTELSRGGRGPGTLRDILAEAGWAEDRAQWRCVLFVLGRALMCVTSLFLIWV